MIHERSHLRAYDNGSGLDAIVRIFGENLGTVTHCFRLRRALSSLFIAWLLYPLATSAAPTLLAQYEREYQYAYECRLCIFRAEEHFDLVAVGNLPPYLPVVSIFGHNDDGTFGYPIAVGTVGSFDFNEANAPGFDALAERLTDTRNDNLIFSFDWGTTNDRAGEAAAFGGLLTDRRIDFLRLVVEDLSWVLTDTGGEYSMDITWQVWGKGEPLPSAAPEPAPIALFAVGFAGLAFTRRRCRRQKVTGTNSPEGRHRFLHTASRLP